jgi:hypothetical protein
MSLYQCENCGCAENTALSNYWWEHVYKKGKKLCSACSETGYKPKVWHGQFPRVFLPKGMFETDAQGNLRHKQTGETDFRKYALPAEEGST